MADSRKEQLEKSIAGFKKQISTEGIAPALKGVLEKALTKAEKELSELAPAASEKKKEEKTEKKEEKAEKKEEKAEEKKKKAEKKKEEKAEEKEEEKDEFFEVKGVKYNMKICKEVVAGAAARKERDKETAGKAKSKSPAVKAAESVETATDKVVGLIPEKEIEENPQRVIDALEAFEAEQTKSLFSFCEKVGISKTLRDKLADAYEKSIAPIIKEIEEEIRAKKKA